VVQEDFFEGGLAARQRDVIWGRMSWGLLRKYEVYEDTEKSTALDEYLAGAGEARLNWAS